MTTVVSGQTLFISAGQTSSGIVIQDDGTVNVLSGGVADGTLVNGAFEDPGTLDVRSGGIASGTVVSGFGRGAFLEVESGGIASGTVISDDGIVDIFGGIATGVVINSGGYEYVESGGVAGATVVNSGGDESVLGGVVSGGVVSSGGSLFISDGVVSGAVVSSGGEVNGLTVTSACGQWSANGANVIDGVTIQSGAFVQININQGGSISGLIIPFNIRDLFPDYDLVNSGGVADGAVLNGGRLVVWSGGVASGTVVGSAGSLEIDGGVASSTVVSSGGILGIDGGVVSGGVVSSGGLVVGVPLTSAYGQWSADSVNVIGGVTIQRGATAGIEIDEGGSISGLVVSAGAFSDVSSGGVANSTVVSNGGVFEAFHGVASGTVVSSGGAVDFRAGGIVRGAEIVRWGGTAAGGTLASGGVERIYGQAGGGVVASGGRQIVESGGFAQGAAVKHGARQIVYSGGVTRGTVLEGGTEIVHGAASGGRVNLRGIEIVYGTASGGTIDRGIIEVASGGTASGTVTFVKGGTLQLDKGASFTGAIKGFAIPDRIDLRGIAFGSGTTMSFAEAAGDTSGTLSVSDGTHTINLTLLGLYATGDFTLSTDNHGGTRVTDPPAPGGGSRVTFADIVPAGPRGGAATPGNQPSYLPAALAAGEQAYTGQTLLATAPPGAPAGDPHHPLLPAPS